MANSTNRLAGETSPYLLQHAHNPVDWYPWGPEAFAAALEQNKPIFLSVGYSTCYWCHVMERQSFENESIAAEMNGRFICIKVDREERPDVDQLYMNAVQALTGQGGWPMSVFLTPDLKPFYGGTYYPPADMGGRVGFPRLLTAISDAWQNRREQVVAQAEELVGLLAKMAEPPPPRKDLRINREFLERLLDRSTADFDPAHGGFGGAPKFPRQTLLAAILTDQRQAPNPARMKQVLHTLDAMAAGGIHDHLGGAFHRYSTDNQWLVPHFEIMLYDNAMLTWCYAEAFAQTGERRYADAARGIAGFILREMTSPPGAFYTAFDAEVDAQEGQSYLWTPDEIDEILGGDSELFKKVYGVSRGPNFSDPHHGSGMPDKNILYLPEPIDAVTEAKVAPMRQALYERRRTRKQPLLDTKVLTSWNSLMIQALVLAAKTLGESSYLAAANKAADFLWQTHRKPDGDLYRSSRDGVAKSPGFLDDYAMFSAALLDLGRRDEAKQLADRMCDLFLDREKGGFYFTAADDPEMIVRQKTGTDTPLPSGNAVATQVMIELGEQEIAGKTIVAFGGQLERIGEGMSAMVCAALRYVDQFGGKAGNAAAAPAPAIVTSRAKWMAPDLMHLFVTVAPGFHLYGHNTKPGLIQTRLAVVGVDAEIGYPPPRVEKFPFADEAIPIYDGTFMIAVRFASAAKRPVRVLLTCQPCDATSCQAARTFEWTIE